MSLELGRSAEGDQAESAEEPAEEGTATSSAADTPDAYADSGASPAPRFSALWATPDTSGPSEPSTAAAPSDDADDAEPTTSGPPTIQGTVVDSDTPETASAPEASSAPDDVDDRETSTAAEDPTTPDTPAVAEELADPSASGSSDAAEPAADTDAASTGEPAADAADDDEPSDAAEAVSVPARASREDMTGRPGAVGTAASVVPAEEETTPVAGSSAVAGRESVAARLEAAAGDLDGPLLGDVEGLRYSWQQIQIGFVDDPREAVVDAAVLVEHTAQALIGALQRRQRLLRSLWDSTTSLDGLGSPAASSPTEAPASGRPQPASGIPDTEDLRLLIQRYRTMFNEICRP